MKKVLLLLLLCFLLIGLLCSCQTRPKISSVMDLITKQELQSVSLKEMVEIFSDYCNADPIVENGRYIWTLENRNLYSFDPYKSLTKAVIEFDGDTIKRAFFITETVTWDKSDDAVKLLTKVLATMRNIKGPNNLAGKVFNNGDLWENPYYSYYDFENRANEARKQVIVLEAIAGKSELSCKWGRSYFSNILSFQKSVGEIGVVFD